MRTTYIVVGLIIGLLVGVVVGYSIPRPVVPVEEYNALQDEYNALQSEYNALKADYENISAQLAELKKPLKVGFIYIGPIGDYGWTHAHEQASQCLEKLSPWSAAL